MKKDKDKQKDKDPSANEPPKVMQVHDLSGRVPGMTDSELSTFLANAKRLLTSGSAVQKKTAEVLVPLIETELAQRQAAKEAAKQERLAKRKKPAATSDETPSQE